MAELTGGAPAHSLAGLAGAYLLARAFSSGAVALTGTEAITNGIPAGATGLVLLVVIVSKFTTGAWIPVVVIQSLHPGHLFVPPR